MATLETLLDRTCPEPNSGCLLWTGATASGYGVAWHKGRVRKAHRLMWEVANGPIAQDVCVCHRCDTPACVNPAHLFLGTRRDNARDMCAKGRRAPTHGAKNPNTKLTTGHARAIRSSYTLGGVKYCDLAAMYKVHAETIARIVRRESWANE